MIPTSAALFITNALILKKSGKLWIYPSQARQVELLDKRHNKQIAYRTLRYHHLNFKNNRLTVRKRRWDRRDDGTVYSLTTGMAYTIAGYQDLLNSGHLWAKDRIKTLLQKYGAGSDSAKKPPARIQPKAPDIPPKKPGETDFEDPEFRKKRGLPEMPPYKT